MRLAHVEYLDPSWSLRSICCVWSQAVQDPVGLGGLWLLLRHHWVMRLAHMEHLTLVYFCSQIHFVDRLGPLPAKSGLLTCDNWLMKTSSRGGSRILLVNGYPLGNECSR